MEVTGTGMPKTDGQNVDVVDEFSHTGVSMEGTEWEGRAIEKYIIFLVILA
jgi:hypothetical protein